jgi:hypothetical protein
MAFGKKMMLLSGLLLGVISSLSSEGDDRRTYLRKDQIVLSQQGIYVHDGGKVRKVHTLHADDKGIYILKKNPKQDVKKETSPKWGSPDDYPQREDLEVSERLFEHDNDKDDSGGKN